MQSSSTLDNTPTVVWGAAEIARVIGRSERQVFHMLEAGLLPARLVGRRWVTTREKLLAFLADDQRA
jgi:hypothetical protein